MDITPTWTSIVELATHPAEEIRTAAIRELGRLAKYLDSQLVSGMDEWLHPGHVGQDPTEWQGSDHLATGVVAIGG